MYGEGWRIQICLVADLVPGLVSVFVLEVGRKVLNDEPVHCPLQRKQRLNGPRYLAHIQVYIVQEESSCTHCTHYRYRVFHQLAGNGWLDCDPAEL